MDELFQEVFKASCFFNLPADCSPILRLLISHSQHSNFCTESVAGSVRC